MSLQQTVAQKHQSLEGEMLFVRNMDILSTMVRIPIVVIGLMLVALSAPIQQSFASSRNLDFTIYQDGSTHVFYELDVDPLELEITVELFGEMIENITIIGEDGFLLSNEINHNLAVIETFGASHISIDYDTQDLVSKTGKIWAFSVDAPVQYSLLTPKDSVIIEMSNFPLSMQVDNEQSHLTFPPGQTNISYYISTLASAQSIQPIPEDATDNSLILYAGIIAAVGIVAIIAIKKSRSSKAIEPSVTIQKEEQPKPQSLDPEAIFKIKRDLREDDKEIINFISANGGQAYESELRKKFLQPRTTMWRAVKRLERQGIIEIEKKDLQNIVKLKSKLEDS
ncbi:MarR family transcriptional regulator [Marine Group I thaumarchaeote]|uniref:MarR family transcriptional regulator n=1 Tax=Marine Group I thaumarchaeote TaxID=2511932 RepID=A0A7K4NMQ8_9ARCH|nr:MarR family transcriptional regulator [Marine Group I thaumarchaeote]